MSIFEKWSWIKRNWLYVLEEATKLDLVFVGGTALNLGIFEEYRASEDIDLYNIDSKTIENPNGRGEIELSRVLGENLIQKGFDVKFSNDRFFYLNSNIKVDIFYDSTPYKSIVRKTIQGTKVNFFDTETYCKMKLSALLCRTFYDARDMVDIFIVKTKGKASLSFPQIECQVIEHEFERRVGEIKRTSKEQLLFFQTNEQINSLPYSEFEKFKGDLVGWLSKFY